MWGEGGVRGKFVLVLKTTRKNFSSPKWFFQSREFGFKNRESA